MADEHALILANAVKSLYLSNNLSDVCIICEDSTYPAHRLVLHAFGDNWGLTFEDDVSKIDWRHVQKHIALAVLKWLYTSTLPDDFDERNLLPLMIAAGSFKLPGLVKLSEEKMVALTEFENCLEMYKVASGANASILKGRAGEIILKNWHHFLPEDFMSFEAVLVCKLFMDIHPDPLHRVVSLGRQDVISEFVNLHSSLYKQAFSEEGNGRIFGRSDEQNRSWSCIPGFDIDQDHDQPS